MSRGTIRRRSDMGYSQYEPQPLKHFLRLPSPLLCAVGLQRGISTGPRSRSESRSGDCARKGGRESPIGPLVLYKRKAPPPPSFCYEYNSKRVTGIDRPMNVILKDLRALDSSMAYKSNSCKGLRRSCPFRSGCSCLRRYSEQVRRGGRRGISFSLFSFRHYPPTTRP
jgi:hypothetical protein